MQSENKKPWKNHIEIKQPIWRDEEKGNARVSSKWQGKFAVQRKRAAKM